MTKPQRESRENTSLILIIIYGKGTAV